MQYLLKVTQKATKSNIAIHASNIYHWHFNWINNEIIAFVRMRGDYSGFNIFTGLTDESIGLSLLIDSLTIAENTNVNTDIVISAQLDYKLFRLVDEDSPNNFHDMLALSRSRTLIQRGESDPDWPIRVRGENIILSTSEIAVADDILHLISGKKKFSSNELKLMNYWRKGIDLECLQYYDESFLSFFKIVEYFASSRSVPNASIPKKYKTKSEKMAYRVITNVGVKSVKDNIVLLNEIIKTRNNYDIAHAKIKRPTGGKMGALYYTYYDQYWDLHEHLKQLSRLFLLKYLGGDHYQLVNSGGLFNIELKKNR